MVVGQGLIVQDSVKTFDFANDIALLSRKWNGMTVLTTKLEQEAVTMNMKVNAKKAKSMKIGNWTTNSKVDEKQVKQVEECCNLGSVMTFEGSSNKNIYEMRKSKHHFWNIEQHLAKQRSPHHTKGQIIPCTCTEHTIVWNRDLADDRG